MSGFITPAIRRFFVIIILLFSIYLFFINYYKLVEAEERSFVYAFPLLISLVVMFFCSKYLLGI